MLHISCWQFNCRSTATAPDFRHFLLTKKMRLGLSPKYQESHRLSKSKRVQIKMLWLFVLFFFCFISSFFSHNDDNDWWWWWCGQISVTPFNTWAVVSFYSVLVFSLVAAFTVECFFLVVLPVIKMMIWTVLIWT